MVTETVPLTGTRTTTTDVEVSTEPETGFPYISSSTTKTEEVDLGETQ
jgi:hypothetical protein